jgi:hypothetical protein
MNDPRLPEAHPVRPGVVTRIDSIYEVDPQLMRAYPQQRMPVEETRRIVAARHDFLEWMHGHFAPRRWSGERDEIIPSGFDRQGFTPPRD